MTIRPMSARGALFVSVALAAALWALVLAPVRTHDAGPGVPAIGMSLEAALSTLGPAAFFGATCDRETEVYGTVAYADIEVSVTRLHVMAFVDADDGRVFAVEIGTDPVRVASRETCAAQALPAIDDLLAAASPSGQTEAMVHTVWKDFGGTGAYTTCRMNWRVSRAPSPFSSPEHIGPDGISTPLPLVLGGSYTKRRRL